MISISLFDLSLQLLWLWVSYLMIKWLWMYLSWCRLNCKLTWSVACIWTLVFRVCLFHGASVELEYDDYDNFVTDWLVVLVEDIKMSFWAVVSDSSLNKRLRPWGSFMLFLCLFEFARFWSCMLIPSTLMFSCLSIC